MKVIYIQPDGTERILSLRKGESLMRAAVRENVIGILGDCGGGLSCSTCHVFVDEAWLDRLPPVGEAEQDLLDFTATPSRPNSRLSCQIRMSEALDGIRVTLPEAQI